MPEYPTDDLIVAGAWTARGIVAGWVTPGLPLRPHLMREEGNERPRSLSGPRSALACQERVIENGGERRHVVGVVAGML